MEARLKASRFAGVRQLRRFKREKPVKREPHGMKLTNVNLLTELAKPEFSDLLHAFHIRTFAKHSIIFEPYHEDDSTVFDNPHNQASIQSKTARPGDYVFIVHTGRIRVYLSCGDKKFTVAMLRPGDVYVSHSNAFVQTLEDSKILIVDTHTFYTRMMSVPQFAISVVRVLGGILKNTFGIIDGLALRDATARLAKYLLDAARRNASDKAVIHLNLSGELLAQTLGASRQTISTLLADFTRSGILRKERPRVYRILDKGRLRELVV